MQPEANKSISGTNICILKPYFWRKNLQTSVNKLGSKGPASITPWSFEGSDLGDTSHPWRSADIILLPIAFSALATKEWESKFHMNQEERASFFRNFNQICAELLHSLPSYHFCPHRHVFIQWGDMSEDLPCLSKSRILKVSCAKTSKSGAMPYFIDDLEEQQDKGLNLWSPIKTSAKSTCSFIGNFHSHPLRSKLYKTISSLNCNDMSFLFEHVETGPKSPARNRYILKLLDSQFILCPRGAGLNSARFFEALALGRIPILISDYSKLPLEESIDYSKFIVRAPENSLTSIPERIRLFRQHQDLRDASELAHNCYWNKLRYQCFFKISLHQISTSILGGQTKKPDL